MSLRVMLEVLPDNWTTEYFFSNSRVNIRYEQNELQGSLLGDKGYAAQAYLYTPFFNPRTNAEAAYNLCHAQQRNVVERTFGQWKRRFPCLSRGLGHKLVTVCDIIIATSVLHNIVVGANDEDNFEDVPVEAILRHPENGIAARDALVQRLFE